MELKLEHVFCSLGMDGEKKTGVKIKDVISDWNKNMRAGWEKSKVLDKIENM